MSPRRLSFENVGVIIVSIRLNDGEDRLSRELNVLSAGECVAPGFIADILRFDAGFPGSVVIPGLVGH